MKQAIAVTVLCVAMMLMGAHVRADDSQSRCTRLGQKWVQFNNSKDISTALSDVFTKDIVYEDVPTSAVLDGAEAFRAFAQGFFEAFPDSRFELGRSACRGQEGFFEWTWIANDGRVEDHRVVAPGFCGTGKQFTVRGVTVMEIRGNRISHNSDYWDLATVLRQLLPEGRECVAGLVGLGE